VENRQDRKHLEGTKSRAKQEKKVSAIRERKKKHQHLVCRRKGSGSIIKENSVHKKNKKLDLRYLNSAGTVLGKAHKWRVRVWGQGRGRKSPLTECLNGRVARLYEKQEGENCDHCEPGGGKRPGGNYKSAGVRETHQGETGARVVLVVEVNHEKEEHVTGVTQRRGKTAQPGKGDSSMNIKLPS